MAALCLVFIQVLTPQAAHQHHQHTSSLHKWPSTGQDYFARLHMHAFLTINYCASRHASACSRFIGKQPTFPSPAHSAQPLIFFITMQILKARYHPPASPAALRSHSQITSKHICESAAAREWLPSPPSIGLSHSADGHCCLFCFIHSFGPLPRFLGRS